MTVGGVASACHGGSRTTTDVDICPAWDRQNLARLSDALQSLGAVDKGTKAPPAVQLMHGREVTNRRTAFGDIDVLLGIPEKSLRERAQYRQLAEDALVLEIVTYTVLVASRPAVIRSKQLADRPMDDEALAELRALEAAEHKQ